MTNWVFYNYFVTDPDAAEIQRLGNRSRYPVYIKELDLISNNLDVPRTFFALLDHL